MSESNVTNPASLWQLSQLSLSQVPGDILELKAFIALTESVFGQCELLPAGEPPSCALPPKITVRARCADCRHFERDTVGDGSGIGDCKIGGEGMKHPALWPRAERRCKDFSSTSGTVHPVSMGKLSTKGN